MRNAIILIIVVVTASLTAHAENRPEFRVMRTSQPPKIDGILDDEVWRQTPLELGDWIAYNPLRGGKSDQRTDVRIAYDERYIYFGIHCFDTEPAKIRTTISRRDTAFNDDWFALSLDSAGTGQTAYHLFVNPSGIQMDALNTSASGEQFEADFVWDSAAKTGEDGYTVEMRLPLQSIRFSGGEHVRMGILFFRKISRTGVSYSWPEILPGQWVFESHAHLLFDNLKQPRLVELLPSVTYALNQTRATPDAWNHLVNKPSAGLSAKYGITSNVTLDATINPDFSQVESDAFQVQVNQRFPIFYSEKRPFFMEGMGLFNVAGTGGDGNMRTSVHTRHIINPLWGSKLTGTEGKFTFGLLNASDKSPEDIGNRGDLIRGQNKLFTIARATYSLGGSNYVGAILTDTEHAGRHNRVEGGDISIKFSPPQQFTATILSSQTGITSSDGTHGVGSQVSYSYNTRRFGWANQIEHYGRDFQMDTAFYNRTGFTSGWSYGEINFYPKEGSWLKRVHPYYWAKRGHDQTQNGKEDFLNTGIRFHFTRQGYLQVASMQGHEAWVGHRFRTGAIVNFYSSIQMFRWLSINGSFNKSRDIYYDLVNPFQGRSKSGGFGFSLQPNQHFQQNLDYNTVRFDRASNGEHIYTVNIVNTQTTYQFDKHFRLRLLEQFDSSQHRLLTDFLAMYEVVPGTVFHAGYGSLYEKDPAPSGVVSHYMTIRRGLFFKASYLHRF
jgi:Domain of unknown function (DUF5916)/Carbohydrate family 9 binding domain-like